MHEDKLFYLIGVGLFLIVALALFFGIKDEMDWQRYAKEHCKVIGEISGSSTTAVGFASNGSVAVTPVYIPGKTGYLCDNGKQTWR